MKRHLSQDLIVFGIFVVAFVGLSVFLDGFLEVGNVLTLLRGVSVLAILGVGMAIVVIGRGIDLAMISNMAIWTAFALYLANRGVPIEVSLLVGLLLALLSGFVSGVLIAYVEIPSLFATLALGIAIYGLGRFLLVPTDVIYLPANIGAWELLGKGFIAGVPVPIIVAAVVGALAFLYLRYTKYGAFTYAIGDNFASARVAGISVRKIQVLQYVISAAVAYLAGLLTATSVSSINTRVVNSTMIYDVILVVVLGGIGLSGGKGGVRNVLVGTLLIGTVVNGMTIMDVPFTAQNIFKGVILLFAIIVDSLVNPRDEQTAQQGDI
ncbi:ABC transporter permease [Paraburkholderia sediminicola]|uniref:ABC transporter permease n=1 Tax=Paraburkholderia sediminicola TaxID=458836 RepID=UPI0038B7598A